MSTLTVAPQTAPVQEGESCTGAHDPLDVPAAVLRQRIRVALSVLGHRNDEQGELLTGLLRGEVEL